MLTEPQGFPLIFKIIKDEQMNSWPYHEGFDWITMMGLEAVIHRCIIKTDVISIVFKIAWNNWSRCENKDKGTKSKCHLLSRKYILKLFELLPNGVFPI